MPFHFSSHGCYARFWSIWGIQQIFSWSANVFAERSSLSTNGTIWQHIEWSSQDGHNQLRYQLPGEHPHVIYLRVYPLPLMSYPEPLQSLQPHHNHLLQLSPGWPFPFLSIGSYVAHYRLSLHLRAALLKRWQPLEHASSRCSPLKPNTLPSWGRFSIIWVLYHLLSTSFLSHKSHHRPLLLYIRLCLLMSRLQERQRQLSHHLHIILQPPSNHFHSFLYIFPLCISLIFSLLE